jgi:hypothetical protein
MLRTRDDRRRGYHRAPRVKHFFCFVILRPKRQRRVAGSALLESVLYSPGIVAYFFNSRNNSINVFLFRQQKILFEPH